MPSTQVVQMYSAPETAWKTHPTCRFQIYGGISRVVCLHVCMYLGTLGRYVCMYLIDKDAKARGRLAILRRGWRLAAHDTYHLGIHPSNPCYYVGTQRPSWTTTSPASPLTNTYGVQPSNFTDKGR